MKILLLVPELNVGGVETHVLSLAEGLTRMGHNIIVISNGGALVPSLESFGVEHLALPVHRKSPLTIREMASRVQDIIRQRQIDIVHAHSRVPAWIAHFAIRGTGCSLILSAHGQYAPHIGSRVMALGDRVICVSRVIRDHIVANLGAPPLNTCVVYNGIDLSKVERSLAEAKAPETLKAELGLPADAQLVGLIGRLTATKGVRFFIESFAKLRKNHPGVCGVVVGEGPMRRELQEQARALGVGDAVAFPGVRTDIVNFLNALDVFVVSSLSEGFPMGCLEALSCRVPIVATCVGGVPEMLTDGETALLVEPRDSSAMADRIGELLRKPELREKLIDAGFRNVRERFSRERMIEGVLEVYREALEEKAAPPAPTRGARGTKGARVLLTLPELNVGGVETHVVDLARGLQQRGYHPLVVSFGGKLVPKLDEAGVDHIRMPVHSKSPIVIFRMASAMRSIMEKNRIRMVHAHSRVPAWISYVATRGMSIPFITTAHSTYSVHLGSRVMIWSDQIIAVSGYVRDHMIRSFGAPEMRTTVVHNGVSIQPSGATAASRLRDEWGVSENGAVVGMVASLTPRKGYGFLLKAAHEILEQYPDSVFLAIGGGAQRDELINMRTQLGIPEERFRFLGVRSDVRDLLSAMDVFVLSSTSEGLPYVILEAMAMGRPIVSSDVGGIPEAVTSGVEGILFSPGNIERLSDAIRQLIADPARRREMGELARRKVEQTFTVERMVDETESIYRRILN